MNDLELYREELANCDAKITEALKERYAIIEKIMAYKEEYGSAFTMISTETRFMMYLSESSATVRRSRLESFLITTLS